MLIALRQRSVGNEAAVKLASSSAADGIAMFRVLFLVAWMRTAICARWTSRKQAFSVLLDGAVPYE
ncbi:hypothetical protein ACVXG8_27520 [Escherichia coli]